MYLGTHRTLAFYNIDVRQSPLLAVSAGQLHGTCVGREQRRTFTKQPFMPCAVKVLKEPKPLGFAQGKQEMDLSRFRAAPSARLSHLAFEGDWAFSAQR